MEIEALIRKVLREQGFSSATPDAFAECMLAHPAAMFWMKTWVMSEWCLYWTEDLGGPVFAVEVFGEQFIKA